MSMVDGFRDVILDLKATINKITNHLSGKDRYDKNLEALSMYKTALHDAGNKLDLYDYGYPETAAAKSYINLMRRDVKYYAYQGKKVPNEITKNLLCNNLTCVIKMLHTCADVMERYNTKEE